MVESTAKLRAEIKALSGVDIMLNNNTFKSTYQILDELSLKWKDLSDISQATIVELMAGKHQGNVFASLMTNFQTARDALNTSLESSGSAMKEHAKWSESIEARLNKLKAAWQSFAQSFMDSDTLKAGIDILKTFVEVLEWTIDNLGILGTVGLGVAGKNIFSYFKGAKEAKKDIGDVVRSVENLADVIKNGAAVTDEATEANLRNAASEATEANANTASTTSEVAETEANLASTATELVEAEANATSTTSEFAETEANTASTTSELAEAEANATSAASELAEAEANTTSYTFELAEAEANAISTTSEMNEVFYNTASIATEATEATVNLGNSAVTAGAGAVKATKGFKGFFSTLGGKIAIVGFAISAISAIYNEWKKSKEEAAAARQEAIETADAFLDASSTFEQAYIKYSGRTDLTAEEEAELESAINGTVEALGDKSSALQNAVNVNNDYVASLEAIKKAELEQAADSAQEKKEKAQEALDEAAKGWSSLDGSEVNIDFGATGMNGEKYEGGHMADIAKNLAQKYFGDDWSKYLIESHLSGTRGGTDRAGLNLSTDASVDEIVGYYNLLIDLQKELENSGYKGNQIYNNVTAAIEKMSGAMDVYVEGVYDSVKANYLLNEVSGEIPKTAEEYVKMREAILADAEVQNLSVAQKMGLVNLLDSEYGKSIDLSDAKTQARRLIGVLDEYKYNKDDANQVETFLNMRTAVNDNECTVGDYLSEFDRVRMVTAGWDEEEKEIFNTSFGIDSDSIKQQYDDVYRYITRNHLNKLNTEGMSAFNAAEYKATEIQRIKDLLGGLTLTELQAVANIKADIDFTDSIADIKKQIEEEAKLIEAISFTVDLDLETEKLDNLTTAVTESLSGSGLGNQSISLVEDMFGDLDNYDPNELFERTANGIRLNSEELRKLNDEYKQSNIDGLEEKMDALGEKYNQTRDKLSDLTYGSEEYNQKLSELNDIEAQINATEQLASQYRGLASAYQLWQRTESAGSQRDMYESMIEGLENVDDEISRGWLDDGTIEFLRLIKGDTLSATATTKDLKAAYESLDDTIKNTTYSIRDFFTVDEDGNSTNTGVYNFLDAIGQLEEEKFGGKDVVKRDDDGNIIGFDFKIVGGDEAIADALGISEELVQIMVRAADDAGFVVSMDGTYQQLDTLKDKAQEAADKLKETFKLTEFEFNLGTGNEKSIEAQYKEALKIWEPFTKNKNSDGTINMDVEGAEDAFTLVSTLQSMVDQLGEPVYMELDATQVEKDIQTPLSKLQEYERLVQQENQLKLKGTDTSEIDKSQEEIIDYFEELDPEIQASLGIKDLSREEIQAKVEAGEIEIPATVDLQVEMNQTMRDMVNVALYNAGLIKKEEFEKRVDVEVYAENVNAEDVDEAVKEEIENTKSDKRKKNIEIIAETVGIENVDDLSSKLEGLDDTTVKAIAEVLGQVDVDKLKDTMAKLEPKQVEAIATAIGEGDVDSLKTAISDLSPTYVQAIAEAFGYSDVQDLYNAIDNLDPKTVEAVANALGITDVESLKGAVDSLADNDVYATAHVSGKSDVDGLNSSIDTLKSKDGTKVTIKSVLQTVKETIFKTGSTRNDSNGFSDVNGTAHANGTTGRAFKQGNWRTKKSETALTGELGREIIVTPNNEWYTVGDNGAEFVNVPRGSIVFNHKQTEELLSNGKVTSNGGRAKTFVSGTAFAGGSRGFGGFGKVVAMTDGGGGTKKTTKKTKKETVEETIEETYGTKSSKNGSSGSGGTGSSSKTSKTSSTTSSGGGGGGGSSKEEFKETLDWIETKIDRIERAIDKLDLKANSVYKNWSTRNKALSEEIVKVGEEIDIQQAGYERYLKEANNVGLSASWAEKVRNGKIDIETIKDEDLAEKIKEYQQW